MKWVFALTLWGMAVILLNAAPVKSKANQTSQAKSQKTSRTGKRKHAGHVAPAPSYQLRPDPERYQEIQKALADRGYFKGEVNGAWADDSVDALKRFQTDQKLDNDGKINALSLTGLGLGPKHDGSSLTPPPQ